jgi:hypothetical protein
LTPIPNKRIDLISHCERIVVAVYASAFIVPFLVAGMGTLFGYYLPYPISVYVLFLPLSITFWGVILLPFSLPVPLVQFPFWFSSIAFVFFIPLIVFYPLVMYYLWRRNRTASLLSTISCLGTIILETYSASIAQGGSIWIFGIGANLVILYLLWRAKNSFFRQPQLANEQYSS